MEPPFSERAPVSVSAPAAGRAGIAVALRTSPLPLLGWGSMGFARTNSCSRPLTFRWLGLADGKGCVTKAARTVDHSTETGDRIPERGEGGRGDALANALDGPVRQGPQCALPSPPRATVSTALLWSYAGPRRPRRFSASETATGETRPASRCADRTPSNLPGPLPPGWNVAALRASGSHRSCGRAGDDGTTGG
jgi:hypothetical protein